MVASGAVFKFVVLAFLVFIFVYNENAKKKTEIADFCMKIDCCTTLLQDKLRRNYRNYDVCTKLCGKRLFLLLLLYLCGDIETCPGPMLYDVCKQSGLKIFHQCVRGLDSSYEGIYEELN